MRGGFRGKVEVDREEGVDSEDRGAGGILRDRWNQLMLPIVRFGFAIHTF